MTRTRDPGSARDPLSGRSSDRDKLAALDELFEATKTYRVPATYAELLDFLKKMRRLSPYNGFLLHMQNRGAKYVLTPRQWETRFGRTVRPFARALVILQPRGPVAFVYDISDTDGPELPRDLVSPFGTSGHLRQGILERTISNCARDLVRVVGVDMGKGLAGVASIGLDRDVVTLDGQRRTARYRVQVNPSLDAGAVYASLCHELAHIYLGHVGTHDGRWWSDRSFVDKNVREFEAESVAWLVAERAGISNPSASYLAGYLDRGDEIPPISLHLVLTVAGYIELMGRRRLKPREVSR